MKQTFDSKTIYLWSVERKNASDEHSRKHKEDMALVKQHVNYESDGRGSADWRLKGSLKHTRTAVNTVDVQQAGGAVTVSLLMSTMFECHSVFSHNWHVVSSFSRVVIKTELNDSDVHKILTDNVETASCSTTTTYRTALIIIFSIKLLLATRLDEYISKLIHRRNSIL